MTTTRVRVRREPDGAPIEATGATLPAAVRSAAGARGLALEAAVMAYRAR